MSTGSSPPPREPLGRHTREPFRGSVAVREGRTTPGRLRGPAFLPVLPDTWVGADVEVDADVMRRALAVWGGATAVVGGALAAQAYEVPTPDDLPEVVIPGVRRRAPAGVLVRCEHLRPEETTTVAGVRVTTPCRTAFDLARRLDLPDGVAAVDALARRFRFRPAALRRLVVLHSGARHVERVRAVVALMDGRAGSLPESRLRLALVARGVPSPDLQVEVPTPVGCFWLDLGWRAELVAVEYDGEEHRSITRHGRDLDRDAALADRGWLVIRVTARQLARPEALAARVRRILRERSDRGMLECRERPSGTAS